MGLPVNPRPRRLDLMVAPPSPEEADRRRAMLLPSHSPCPVEPVECPLEAADRELAEEIGAAARKAGLLPPAPTRPTVSRLPSDRMTRPVAPSARVVR